MNKYRCLVKTVFAVFVFFPVLLYGQSYEQFKHITEKDGLSYREVRTITESSPGEYWIGTARGLQFYNGHHFFNLEEIVGHDPIGVQLVQNLQMSNDSLLFIHVRNNLFKLNTKSLQLKEYKIPDPKNGEFLGFYKNDSEEYWVKIFHDHIKLFTWKNEAFSVIDSAQILKNVGSGFNIFKHDQYVIWSSSMIGIRVIDLKTNRLVSSNYTDDYQYNCALGKNGSVYFTNNLGKLYRLNKPYDKQFEIVSDLNIGDCTLYSNPNIDEIWVVSDRIISINFEGNTKYHEYNLSELSVPFFRSVFFDSANNLWLITFDGIIVSPSNDPICQIFHKSKTKKAINEMRSIILDEESVFIIPEYEGDFIYKISHQGEEEKLDITNLKGEKISNFSSYYPVVYDNKLKRFWISTNAQGLGLLDTDGKYQKMLDYPEAAFVKLKNGKILIGRKITEMVLLDPTTAESESIDVSFPLNEKGFINSFLELEDGRIIITGLDGIFIINIDGKILHHLNTNTVPNLPHNDVAMISQGEDGNYWGGTKGGGIFSLSEDFTESTHYGLEHGLPNLWVPIVIPIENEQILAATYSGLSVLSPKRGDFRNYYKEHGLSHNEFNTSSFLKKDSFVYLGTLDGVNKLNTNKIPVADSLNTINLSLIKIYNKNLDSIRYIRDAKSLENGLTMGQSETWMEIYFSISDFLNPEKNIYKYMIEGLDAEWQTIIGQGMVRLEGIPPGQYTVRIKGANLSNVPCINELSIPLRVREVFYKTPWFIFLTVFTIGLLVFSWFWRINNENVRLEREVEQRTIQLKKEQQTIKKQAGDLKKLDDLKNQFFANISHELRTPLTLLVSPLDKLTKEGNLSESQKYFIQLMKENSKLLQERIEELLELSKLDANEAILHKQTVHLFELIDFSTRIFKSRALEKNITYEIHLSGTEVNVVCDEKRLAKIIQNLIGNAIKFTPREGKVVCDFVFKDDELSLTVEDSGIGIAQDEIDKIFDRFYQIKKDNSNANPGTGIGLAMVKDYVNLMNGTIDIDSELGKGTVLNVSFPIQKADSANIQSTFYEIPTEKFSFEPIKGANVPTLLLAEDNKSLRGYIHKLLIPYFNIIEAADGQIALNILKESSNVDIILSDIMMPELDGISLLSEIKKDKKLQLKPFVFLTAKHNEEDILQAYRMGVDDYLKKPFSEDQLLYRIHAVYKNYLGRMAADAESEQDFLIENADSKSEETFISKLHELIIDNLGSHDFSVNTLAEKLGVSNRNFIRLVKKEIGMSPKDYIREVKLNKARTILESRESTDPHIVSSMVGFNTTSYFLKLYHQRFGSRFGE